MARKRKGKKSNKGGGFERETCKQISDWWVKGRDDIFWRSSNSGGRATVRGRKGKSTFGHCGDVAATDPCGLLLLDFITIELKRGYSVNTLHDLLDRPRDAAQQQWEAWIQQAVEASNRAGSYSWIIVSRRDQRKSIVLMPREVVDALHECWDATARPFVTFSTRVRFKHEDEKKRISYTVRPFRVSAMLWETWLSLVNSITVRTIAKRI